MCKFSQYIYHMVPKHWPWYQKRTLRRPENDLPSLHKDLFFAIRKTFSYWLSKLKRKCWSNSIIVACISINWRLRIHIYNPKWYGLPWLQHGFKQSHHDSQHYGKNTTALSQNIVARRSDFEMLLTNGLYKGTHNNEKDLLTNRKNPWAESKDLKAFYSKINSQGLKRT